MDIIEIDQNLNEIILRLKEKEFVKYLIARLFESSLEFKIDGIEKSDLKNIDKKPGIYLFYILNEKKSNEFEKWFTKIWNTNSLKKIQHSPVIIKERISKKDYNEKWIELYIGKSKNIHKRIEEHIFLEGSKSTYALKLKSRNFSNLIFKINWLVLEDLTQSNVILNILESEIRNQLLPIIGKQ